MYIVHVRTYMYMYVHAHRSVCAKYTCVYVHAHGNSNTVNDVYYATDCLHTCACLQIHKTVQKDITQVSDFLSELRMEFQRKDETYSEKVATYTYLKIYTVHA